MWAVLEETGPALGLPTLRTCFPEVPRCILADLLGDYRRMYQSEHRLVVEALQWTRPGLVWAIDHTQPPRPIDGIYSQVLAVRDLASGLQLAWTAVSDATADEALLVLESLFHTYGPPLVLKSDNGSAFISHRWKELLERWQIAPLLSPPRTPRYNGSCEAGIGAGKTRTAYLAARQGRAGLWTSDDLEACAIGPTSIITRGDHPAARRPSASPRDSRLMLPSVPPSWPTFRFTRFNTKPKSMSKTSR